MARNKQNKDEHKSVNLTPWNPYHATNTTDLVLSWIRLESFCHYHNQTIGSYRTNGGYGALFINSGWWLNPIKVEHIAGLAKACYQNITQQLSAHDYLHYLTTYLWPFMNLLCGSVLPENWNNIEPENIPTNFNSNPPEIGAKHENNRNQDFWKFLATEQERLKINNPDTCRSAISLMKLISEGISEKPMTHPRGFLTDSFNLLNDQNPQQ